MLFSDEELAQFHRDGYVIARGVASQAVLERMRHVTVDHLKRGVEPIEFEADVHYPGSPQSKEAEGGDTVRRLRAAHSRDQVFVDWLQSAAVVERVRQILGPAIVCPLAHHNCVMTKQPRHSSETHWHQDIRYWSFERRELVSVWLALGDENLENGGLWVVPGSHVNDLSQYGFDQSLFFREDVEKNQELLSRARSLSLRAGDVLFFHCRLLHAAGRNQTGQPKYSVVFTYRAADNAPQPGSRSASMPEIVIPTPSDAMRG